MQKPRRIAWDKKRQEKKKNQRDIEKETSKQTKTFQMNEIGKREGKVT